MGTKLELAEVVTIMTYGETKRSCILFFFKAKRKARTLHTHHTLPHSQVIVYFGRPVSLVYPDAALVMYCVVAVLFCVSITLGTLLGFDICVILNVAQWFSGLIVQVSVRYGFAQTARQTGRKLR